MEKSIGAQVDKFLIMEYKAEFILDLPVSEGIEYAIEAYKMREENRLHQVWLQLVSNPYAKVTGYEEFKDKAMGDGEDNNEEQKDSQDGKKKMSTLKGRDLTRG